MAISFWFLFRAYVVSPANFQELINETYISTQSSETQKQTRFSRSNEKPRWKTRAGQSTQKGPQIVICVIMDLLKPIFTVLDRSVAFLFLFIIYVYKYALSPFFGNRCRFHPTCSSYALQALKTKNVIHACVLIIKRLSKCHPLHSGGFDPVK